MIVAVTGGTGFIGQKLITRLLEQDNTVRLLTRRSTLPENFPPVELHRCDLTTAGVAELAQILEGVEVLYHCAGQLTDTRAMKALHVDATHKLILAASGRIKRWVQLSSVGVYGNKRTGVVTELTELNPCGKYETSKAESESLARVAAQGGAFELAILRPSNVYAATMSNQSLFGLIAMIRRGLFFFIGRPGATANYIHADNVVDALLLCGTRPVANGQIYNLSDCRTMEQFVSAIAGALGRPVSRMRMPELPVRMAAKVLGLIPGSPLTESRVDALSGRAIYANNKIEQELGYRHHVSMEAGLSEMVAFWQRGRG